MSTASVFARQLFEAMAQFRAGACGVGQSCRGRVADERMPAAVFARPYLGHYVVRGLGDVVGRDLTEVVSSVSGALSGLSIPGITLDEQIAEVRVRWAPHRDGGLELQGYLELVVRLVDPAIQIGVNASAGIFGIGIEAARLRVRFQPYFYLAQPPAVAHDPALPEPDPHCDTCGRRRPDQSIHMAVVGHPTEGTGLFADTDLESRPPAVSGDCASCLASNGCGGLAVGGLAIRQLEDLRPGIAGELRRSIAGSVGQLDKLVWHVTADPRIGGVLLGRLDATRALWDATCGPSAAMSGAPRALPQNPECGGTAHVLGQEWTVDTVEQLRIGGGRADVLSRDNPDAPGSP
jgi:hypothetical protein